MVFFLRRMDWEAHKVLLARIWDGAGLDTANMDGYGEGRRIIKVK